MRLTRTHLGIAAIAGLALVACTLLSGPAMSSALEPARTIELIVGDGGGGAAIDVGKPNKSSAGAGDYFITTNAPLLDPATGRRVGRLDAMELVFGRSGEFWTITVRLADGTLQVNGERRHPRRVNVLPVVGGTGAYANVRGTLTLTEIGERGGRLSFSLVP